MCSSVSPIHLVDRTKTVCDKSAIFRHFMPLDGVLVAYMAIKTPSNGIFVDIVARDSGLLF